MVLLREVDKYWVNAIYILAISEPIWSPVLSLSTLSKLKMGCCSFLLLLSIVAYSPGGQRVSLNSTYSKR